MDDIHVLQTKKKSKPQTRKGRKVRKIKKGLTHKSIGQTGSGFSSDIFNWLTSSNKRKFYKFKKLLSRNLSDIEKKKKHVEQLAKTYESYSEDRLKVINELIVVMRAEKIFPWLETKVVEKIKKAQEDPKKMAREYEAELSDAKNKVKELAQKKKSLETQNKTLYDKLKTYKKNYEEEFKKVEKYMNETITVQKYYAENIQSIDTKLDRIKKDYDLSMGTPETERTSFQKRAVKKYKKYESLFKLFHGEQGGLQPKQKLDQLTRQKNELSDLRKNMEHYNNYFDELAPKNITDWQENIEACVRNISLSMNSLSDTEKKLKKILENVNRCYTLTATQQMIDYSKKFDSFKKPVEDSIQIISKIKSIIKDVEQNFYNLTPAARLDYNLQYVLLGLKTVATLLDTRIKIYINDDTTRFEYMETQN